MVVSILGCGWYGRALAAKLLSSGIPVKGSATSPERAEQLHEAGIKSYVIKIDEDASLYDADFFKCDIVVIAIPPGLRKNQGHQYLPKIKRVIKAIADHKITKAIYISSTGVYADCNREVNENDMAAPDSESGRILHKAEKLFLNESGLRTSIVRFGGLVGPGRDPAQFFSNKTDIPNGLAPVNLIHQIDCVGITCAIIEKDSFGFIFNASAPDHPAKGDFYRKMAAKAGLPRPVFVNELKDWKIVNSVNLSSKLNFSFVIDSWDKYPSVELG
jgi:nucleoside-diphosphate-sugar epimerase